MRASPLKFIRNQWSTKPPVHREDLSGKTVVVVGANTGLGFEAAKHFATMSPGKLILACRSQARGEAALAKLQQETGCKTVELWIVDLGCFASVRAFVDRFEKEGGRLDILVENAAIIPGLDGEMTDDGWEATIQTNDLSPSLHALLLVPHMIQTARKYDTLPRIVIVSSGVHYWSRFDKALIGSPSPLRSLSEKWYARRNTNPATIYYDSKLLNVLFTRALASHLQNQPLIVNTVDPGYCLSNLRKFTGFSAFTHWIMDKVLAISTEQGSRQLVWAALGGEKGKEDGLGGAFISYLKVQEASDYIISEEGYAAEQKLWKNLIDELSQVDPRVGRIVDEYCTNPNSSAGAVTCDQLAEFLAPATLDGTWDKPQISAFGQLRQGSRAARRASISVSQPAIATGTRDRHEFRPRQRGL